MTGDRIGRQLSLATRRELIEAIAERYHAARRTQKKQILRKHALREPPGSTRNGFDVTFPDLDLKWTSESVWTSHRRQARDRIPLVNFVGLQQ
jgi:hypothetical protein